MRAALNLPANSGNDQALDAFNALVRNEVPSAVRASLGHFAFTYQQYAFVAFLFAGPGLVVAAEPYGLRQAANDVFFLLWILALWPVVFVAVEECCSLCGALRGIREVAFVGAGGFAVLGFLLAAYLGLNLLAKRAAVSAAFLGIECCIFLVCTAAVASTGLGLFRGPRCRSPAAEITGVVAGSAGYLKAVWRDFSFSAIWP